MSMPTIAKIEAGDRTVRIDEATAIADLFGLSLDALLGRKGMEDDRSHALSVLADEAQAVVPELMAIRDRIWRAHQELSAHWDFESFDTDAWSWDDLSLDHRRALLAWNSRDLAASHLSIAISSLTDVVALRSMTPEEVRNRVNRYDAYLKVARGEDDETQS